MARTKKSTTPTLPFSHLELMDAMGFEAVSWQNVAVMTKCEDGTERREWLPEDLINWNERLFVRFRKAGDGPYDFDGWEPKSGHSFGGRYRSVQSALTWFPWFEAQKARA